MAASDAVLIARAQAGDHAAFESIFNQYQTAIYNYIYRLMGSAEDAYDLTQDTFLKAYLALAKTSDDLRVGAWLYRIATNVCLDELRHRKLVKWQPWESFVSLFHPSQVARDNPERDALQDETRHEVEAVLDRLSPRYRAALILREYHGLGYEEIAQVLGTTRTAVKTLLLRARESFRYHYVKTHPKLAAQARGPRVLPRLLGRPAAI
jgi:RNA polymerase sigma-70 factor (ECF subfamily)